uniref:Translocon at the inner envelope membrane of chloroplasts 214 n=1 Tax=Gossypium raimondii TaxID=29730 RepID=A0A0D2MXX1_GOSRA|nr:hypothetical protein B456_004G136300 [Gossypium raimondii]
MHVKCTYNVWGLETELPFGSTQKWRSNKNEKAFCDLSSLSQAYVFYKLSQTQVISFYKFKPILQYHGTSLFLKNEIKDWFEKQGVPHSRLRHHYGLRQKIIWHSRMNEWKNWDLYAYGSPFQMLWGFFSHRKFFNWRFLHFCLRNKVDIESWVNTNTKSNKNIKTVQPIEKKGSHFDWMRLNEEILSRPIPNLELWFFPEFVLLYNAYKGLPYSTKRKKVIGLENRNQEEKGPICEGGLISNAQKQGNFKSVLSNQEKDVEEDYYKSDKKKEHRKKKQYKSNTKAKVDFFLKRYLRFQLRWDDSLNQRIINNIKVYYLFLRLINPNEIVISSI